MSETDKSASKFLGKKVASSEKYDASLLVAVPRSENRKQYNISEENLPFFGYDIWHAYEFSTLTNYGLPVTRLLKIKYNCDNKFLVESKSLKLYFNSFNMSKFGDTIKECLTICKQKIEEDLSKKLITDVQIDFMDNLVKREEIFSNFTNLTDLINESSIRIEQFKEAPDVLKTEQTNSTQEYRLTFDSLRSNCRVTHQPDFGDVFIYYKSSLHILESALVAYLSSFRSEYHFHEECCEMIFKRLSDLLNNEDELFVCCLYTRRGGIDICPVRWSKNCTAKDFTPLLETTIFTRYGIKQ